MALITLTLAKKHLRVDSSDEDREIELYMAAAERAVSRYIDRVIYPSAEDSPPGAPPSGDDGTAIEIDATLTVAIMLLVGHFYDERKGDASVVHDALLPRSVRALLAPYRIWRQEPDGHAAP
jgi:hypothetical protein